MISQARKLVISLELNELGKKLARLFLENPTVVIFIVYVVRSKKEGRPDPRGHLCLAHTRAIRRPFPN
jgi:hypothetical protein